MKITAIKQQVRNPNRVSIFVDGKYSFSLTLDQLLDLKLKKTSSIKQSDIKRYKKLSDEGKLKQRALEWLANRPHSVREFRDYTYRKKLDKDVVEAWLEEFTAKKYLDDVVFARWLTEIKMSKNKSVRAVSAELRAKGVSQSIIDKTISEISNGDAEALKKVILKVGSRPRYKDPKKLTAYLISKGFFYSDIKQALTNWQSGLGGGGDGGLS